MTGLLKARESTLCDCWLTIHLLKLLGKSAYQDGITTARVKEHNSNPTVKLYFFLSMLASFQVKEACTIFHVSMASADT